MRLRNPRSSVGMQGHSAWYQLNIESHDESVVANFPVALVTVQKTIRPSIKPGTVSGSPYD